MSSLLVFNRVCRLKIQSVMLVFSNQLCELFSDSPPKQKEGRGPHTDKHLPQSLFTGLFLDNDFGIAFYQSNLSTVNTQVTKGFYAYKCKGWQ
jgi:hypothetical protein